MKLSELRRIAEARTKGRWRWDTDCLGWLGPQVISAVYDGVYASQVECSKKDKAFIAAMANHADAILDVLEAAQDVGELLANRMENHYYWDAPFTLKLNAALAKLKEIK